MKTTAINRRKFLTAASLSALPVIVPAGLLNMAAATIDQPELQQQVNFVMDGIFWKPEAYAASLTAALSQMKNVQDFYGNGGVVAELEKRFAEITGKEKAVYLPSGTFANNLAISLLSEGKTKVIVQETSHIYRDEADAAQVVFQKRLVPVAPDKASFSLKDMQDTISYYKNGEAFKTDIGAVSIETPVRRKDNEIFPFAAIQQIAGYCKANQIKLHLDGARLHISSAYSGVPLKEYAACFDTVYISLYKYLGTAGGAMLCGEAKLINQVPHLIKVHGGTVFQSWPNAVIALTKLDTIEEMWNKVKIKGIELLSLVNETKVMKMEPVPNGSNVYYLQILKKVDYAKFQAVLNKEKQILLSIPAKDNRIRLFVNESLLGRSCQSLVNDLKDAVKLALIAPEK